VLASCSVPSRQYTWVWRLKVGIIRGFADTVKEFLGQYFCQHWSGGGVKVSATQPPLRHQMRCQALLPSYILPLMGLYSFDQKSINSSPSSLQELSQEVNCRPPVIQHRIFGTHSPHWTDLRGIRAEASIHLEGNSTYMPHSRGL
jgi:hypothetical protein